MPEGHVVAAAVIKVDGAELTLAQYDDLLDVRVEQSVHVPDKFTLRFRDPNFELLDKGTFKIGATIDVGITDDGAPVPITRAEVTAIGAEQGASGRHELVISGLDRGHRLARGPMQRTFVKMSDSQVVAQIAQEHGLSASADSSSITHEYLLQSETAYAFVSARARAIGYDWWVNDKTLHFKKEAKVGAGPTLTFGEDLVRFKVRASCAEAGKEVLVRAWDAATQKAIVGQASMTTGPGVDFGTTAPLATEAMNGAKLFSANTKRGTNTSGVWNANEANLLAQSLAAWATGEYVTARGEALGNPKIKAGAEVEIKGMGQKLSGKYVLTTVEHIIGLDKRYLTRFVSGGKSPDTLVDLLAGPPAAAGWGERGLVIGIVTNNKDPEGLGRIKVKFPTLSDQEESWWARVAAIGAGPERGLSVLYEINDEVLVAFEHGDLRRPIILGGLWSTQKKPHMGGKETDTAGVEARTWRSRTGHTVALNDSTMPATSFVSITLADKKTVLKMAEDKVLLHSPTPITIESDQGITIKATADLTIDAMNITMKAQNAINIEGTQLTAKGRATTNVEGATTTVKGSATVSVEGGALAAVKGAIVKLN
ncbi:MAG: VgrG-related protein [Acidimicrobiales bacterium]